MEPQKKKKTLKTPRDNGYGNRVLGAKRGGCVRQNKALITLELYSVSGGQGGTYWARAAAEGGRRNRKRRDRHGQTNRARSTSVLGNIKVDILKKFQIMGAPEGGLEIQWSWKH